eukprot:XP_001700984.1 predicted protein [Chlamydomonas reinhardtii]
MIADSSLLMSRARPAAAALYFPHRQVKLSQSVPVHAFAAKWTPEAARALTTAQRRSLVQLTANTGVLKNLEVALRVTGVGRTVALEAAAASGRVSVVRSVCGWLKRVAKHPVERPEVEMLVEVAAAAGAVELLRWLKLGQRGAELAYSVALEKACLGGHQGAAELLLRELQGRHPQDCSFLVLSNTSHLCFTTTPLAPAAAPQRLAWLRDRGSSFDEELGDAAASQGRVEEADFLMDMFGTRCVTFTGVEMACERGHMRMLQALQARGYRFDVLSALEAAARGGQLEYVTVDLINAAMEGGNLQLLQFVLDLSPRQRLGAATLEVALHHTAGVDGPTATGGSASLPLFDLLVRRGLPLGTNGSPYVTASTGVEGRPLIAALARTYNCPWGPPGRVLSFAIQAGASLSLVKFMLAEGCPVEEEDWVTIAARAQVGWRVQDEFPAATSGTAALTPPCYP